MFLLRPFRFLAQVLTAEDSSRQCAAGFSLGMIVGLIPKGNLTAIVLMTILCASRVNLAAGLLSAFLFSWIGMLLDPVAHNIGIWVLTQDALEPTFTWLYNLPVMPWTSFNNTVVLGSLLLGLACAFPLYRLTEPQFAKYVPLVREKLQQRRVTAWLFGAEWAGKIGGG